MRLDTCVALAGRRREEGTQGYTAHVLTPETASSTHYFLANARSYNVDDRAFDEGVRYFQQTAYGKQDRRVLEAVQETMGDAELMSLNPVLLSIDAGAMRARRVLRQMIAAEQPGIRQPALQSA